MEVIAQVTTDISPRLGLLPAALQAQAWTALTTGKVAAKVLCMFFLLWYVSLVCVGFSSVPGVGQETDGGSWVTESRSCFWIISSSEDGEQLGLFWYRP